MKSFRRIIFLLTILTTSFTLQGQDKIEITEQDYSNSEVEMADKFRADGKIYVVVAVILVILGGMFFYLIRIDRKVKKLEDGQA